MRIARVLSPEGNAETAIEPLLNSNDLDFLQLDYSWDASQPNYSVSYARGFFKQLDSLKKSLFLEPSLRVISDAGGKDTTECVEKLGQILCDIGSPNLLISAIRSENMLARLEELHLDGISLIDEEHQIDLMANKNPLLSAQVEIGAAPIATALVEGANCIISGSYDPSAPFIAASVFENDWTWQDWDKLAASAAASEYNLLTNSNPHHQLHSVEIEHSGRATFHSHANDQQIPHTTMSTSFADVQVDNKDFQICESDYGIGYLQGVVGTKPSGEWILRVKYESGYNASAMFFFDDDEAGENLERINESTMNYLAAKGSSSCKVEVMQIESNKNRDIRFLRVVCCSSKQSECEKFVNAVSSLVVRDKVAGSALADLPIIQQATKELRIPIPRESVHVSVDTRPAKEWI